MWRFAKSRGDADAIGLQILDRAADQPRHLSRMRRDDQVAAFAADQQRRLVGEGIERIGVEHQRAFALVEQLADERRHAFAAAEARARDDHVGVDAEHGVGRGEVNGAFGRLVEAFGHVFGGVRGDRRLARSRRRHRHQAGARAHRALRAQAPPRRPCPSSRRPPARARNRPCARRRARGWISGRICSRVSSSMPRPVELIDHVGGNADVGDHHLARLHLRGRQHQRQLRRAERDGDRGLDRNRRSDRTCRRDMPDGMSIETIGTPASLMSATTVS